jgi:hypothetical protein
LDDNYQTYLNRVARMALPETYSSQVQHIQQSPKFQPRPEGGRQAVPFPGYTVITPPSEEESQNFAFYKNLFVCQQQLLQLPLDSGLIVPVPPASFHLTLADLIWESAYHYANEKSEFEVHLRHAIAQIFQQNQQLMTQTNPLRWQILGLTVMPRAIGVCLIPKDENSYERILKFRRTIYQNPGLTSLGIEQHYHFTAHITLGYFGDLSPNLDRDGFASTILDLNQQWLKNSPEFCVHRAELRKFDDMTRYYRKPDWPVLEF